MVGRTLVISRRDAVDRRARMTAQLVGHRDWAFFDAIDGDEMGLSTTTVAAHGRHGRPAGKPLLPGELGCLLSHMAIWRTCLSLNMHRVCVAEDDVEIVDPDSFAIEMARFYDQMPADWLMVHQAGDDVEPSEPVSEHVERVRHAYGTRWMLLTREALLMLGECRSTDCPADWALLPLFRTGRVYRPRKVLVRHRNDPGIGDCSC